MTPEAQSFHISPLTLCDFFSEQSLLHFLYHSLPSKQFLQHKPPNLCFDSKAIEAVLQQHTATQYHRTFYVRHDIITHHEQPNSKIPRARSRSSEISPPPFSTRRSPKTPRSNHHLSSNHYTHLSLPISRSISLCIPFIFT
jgi:hypothetical protein